MLQIAGQTGSLDLAFYCTAACQLPSSRQARTSASDVLACALPMFASRRDSMLVGSPATCTNLVFCSSLSDRACSTGKPCTSKVVFYTFYYMEKNLYHPRLQGMTQGMAQNCEVDP